MEYQNKQNHLSVIEAVETLSEIADIDLEHEIGISSRQDMNVMDEKLSYRTVHWLIKDESGENLKYIKETFRVILHYLKQFCRTEISYVSNEESLEGIKTIMLLVGEAAKKLDRYTHLFHSAEGKSVTELKEFKKLQDFYQNRIAHKIDEGKLGRWLLAISRDALARKKEAKLSGKTKSDKTKHVFVDLDSVKKDTEYELFYIRKEDGTRFFSPRLLRNLKLVSDFGSYFGVENKEDPLHEISDWLDEHFEMAALSILREMNNLRDRFFKEAFQHKENYLVQAIGNCFMALTLAAKARHTTQNHFQKHSSKYFEDFQMFLREALQSREYTKLITYPPSKKDILGSCLTVVINALSSCLYLHGVNLSVLSNGFENLRQLIEVNLNAEQKEEKLFWKRLNNEYAALSRLLKNHQNNPLIKILDNLYEAGHLKFDPLIQKTLQNRLFKLNFDQKKIVDVRFGSPTIQEYINHSTINHEFKALLRSCQSEANPQNLLIINLQDRTSWREYYRCLCLESLQHQDEIGDSLTVVSLARDTDFYHQLPPYDHDNKAEVFIKHFKEHFGDETSGYYVPYELKENISNGFINGLIHAIHKLFFGHKNMLLREHRLNFIELFDVLLILKLIEITNPDYMTLLCKDGVDASIVENALLVCFLKLINDPQGLDEADYKRLNLMIHAPALLVRERVILQERFGRFVNVLKAIETTRNEYGKENFIIAFHEAFQPFYNSAILKSKIEFC